MSGDARLVGTWRLVSFAQRARSGEIVYPLGRSPQGMLVYTAGGHMSVQVMQPGRRPFASSDSRSGTPEESLEAVRGYVAYCGTYRVDDAAGQIIHEPDCSLFPHWIGVALPRHFRLDGDQLALSAAPLSPDPEPPTGLVWQRVE